MPHQHHDPTRPPQDRGSPLRRARDAKGWSLEEAAARVRVRCPGPDGFSLGCRVDADRLHQFETGLAHPGPGHVRILTDLYQQDAAELGLTTGPGHSEPPPTGRPKPPATPPDATPAD